MIKKKKNVFANKIFIYIYLFLCRIIQSLNWFIFLAEHSDMSFFGMDWWLTEKLVGLYFSLYVTFDTTALDSHYNVWSGIVRYHQL